MTELEPQNDAVERAVDEIAGGVDTLGAAAEVADLGREALAEAESDVTRGVDAMVVADRVAQLSEIVVDALARFLEQSGEPLRVPPVDTKLTAM